MLFITLEVTMTKTVLVVASDKGVCRKLGLLISPSYQFIFFNVCLL